MAKVARALPAVLAVAAFAVQFIPGYGQILAVALTAASIGI
jgi:hypothetical protein